MNLHIDDLFLENKKLCDALKAVADETYARFPVMKSLSYTAGHVFICQTRDNSMKTSEKVKTFAEDLLDKKLYG